MWIDAPPAKRLAMPQNCHKKVKAGGHPFVGNRSGLNDSSGGYTWLDAPPGKRLEIILRWAVSPSQASNLAAILELSADVPHGR
jgi:hypothetical protein